MSDLYGSSTSCALMYCDYFPSNVKYSILDYKFSPVCQVSAGWSCVFVHVIVCMYLCVHLNQKHSLHIDSKHIYVCTRT